MPSNTATELREHLFDTLKGLKAGTMKIDQAQAICQTAQTIINSAKVEVDYAKVIGGSIESGFLPAPGLPAGKTKTGQLTQQQPGVVVHRLKG